MYETILLVQAILILFISGILYGFSDFIMKGFNKLTPLQAIEAMRAINASVYKSLFMVLFTVITVSSLGISVWSVMSEGFIESAPVIVATCLYVGGVFFVTGRRNVPLNNELRDTKVSSVNAELVWKKYQTSWNRYNILRCFFGVMSALVLLAPTVIVLTTF